MLKANIFLTDFISRPPNAVGCTCTLHSLHSAFCIGPSALYSSPQSDYNKAAVVVISRVYRDYVHYVHFVKRRKLILERVVYNLSCRMSSPTHDHGGLLDVVLTRNDDPLTPAVDIIDPGLSHHRLLRWTCHLQQRRPSTCRPRTVRGVGWMSRRSDKSCGGRRCAAARLFRRTSTRWLICTTASSTPSSTDFCRCEHPHVEVVRRIIGLMTTVATPSAAADV